MNTYLFRKYLTIGAMAASFVGPAITLIPEASAEIPVETGTILVPTGIQYKTHRWFSPVPPPETSTEVPVETGTLIIPLGPPYRGKTFSVSGLTTAPNAPPAIIQFVRVPIGAYRSPKQFATNIPPVPIVVVEADELTNKRRAIVTPIPPYLGKTYIGATQPPPDSVADIEIPIQRRAFYEPISPYRSKSYVQFRQPTEIDELLPSRRAVFIPPERYASKVITVQPPIAEIVTDTAGVKALFVPVPIIGQRGKVWTRFSQPPDVIITEANELASARRYIEQRRPRPYDYYGLSAYSKPDEIDELLQSRRAQFVPPLPYRSRIWIQGVPPPILIEADELTQKRRVIFNPLAPYRGFTYARFQQPTEIDELLGGRQFIVVPRATYNGESFVVLPQTPEIIVVEAHELQNSRRLIITPHVPYAPNLSRINLIAVPAIIVVEAPELTVAKVRIPHQSLIYPVNLTRAIYRQLDEPPEPHIIVGQAIRQLIDQLVPPVRTPLYARKLGEQIVIVVKDSTPWATWVANVSKRIQSQLNLSVVLDFPPTAAQGYNDALVTVIGAKIGDVVSVAVHPTAVLPNTSYFAFVSAPDQVTIRFSNNHPTLIQDPPSAVFGILVQKQ